MAGAPEGMFQMRLPERVKIKNEMHMNGRSASSAKPDVVTRKHVSRAGEEGATTGGTNKYPFPLLTDKISVGRSTLLGKVRCAPNQPKMK